MKYTYKHPNGEGQEKDIFTYDENKLVLALISDPARKNKDNGTKPVVFKEKHFTQI